MISTFTPSPVRPLLSLAFSVLLAASAAAQETPAQPANPAAAAGSSGAATPPAAQRSKYMRYLKVASAGATARNFGDANGASVSKLPAGTLVAVYEERGDWLECEVPGGFEIWVYGQFVKASSEAGVLEITGSDVRARPLPSSGPESYPLQPNLSKGDRVRLIARNDAAKPLAEDWIKVCSPPGVRGFVAKSECEALASGTDGAAAWAGAVIEARKRTPASSLGAAKAAGPAGIAADSGAAAAAAAGVETAAGDSGSAAPAGPLSPQEAVEALKAADAALAREKASAQPQFAPVRDQYQRVFDSLQDGATKELAKKGLDQVDTLVQALELKRELQAQKERMEQDNLRRQEALAQAAKNKDIYSGRFDTRGWIEKKVVSGQPTTYLIRWGGDPVAEIQCNGRYDLADYVGYEVGINGRELRSYAPGDIGKVAVPRLIDVRRIEVLSGRKER